MRGVPARGLQPLPRAWPARGARAPEIDARLHAERLDDGARQRHHEAELDALPDGTFIVRDDAPWLVHGDRLLRWTPAGYSGCAAAPGGNPARVITPPSLVATLAAGWGPTAVPLIA